MLKFPLFIDTLSPRKTGPGCEIDNPSLQFSVKCITRGIWHAWRKLLGTKTADSPDNTNTSFKQNSRVYQDLPLDPTKNEIRLVHILPRSHAREGYLRCKLTVERIKGLQQDDLYRNSDSDSDMQQIGPSYEALSYCWGSVSEPRQIMINDREFMVADNLFHALCRLQHEKVERTMWIDAICIDQFSDNERNHQVALMRQIYEESFRTVIWLGEVSDSGPAVTSAFDKAPTEGVVYEQSTAKLTDHQKSMIQSAWWSRIWVLQEVVRAPTIIVQSGGSVIEWSDIRAMLRRYQNAALGTKGGDAYRLTVAIIFLQKFSARSSYPRYALGELVQMFRHRAATDPRDKIYGLLGLLEANDFEVEDRPDYSKSVRDVYMEFARSHLADEMMLCSAGYNYLSEDNLPTWCPDWRIQNISPVPFLGSGLELLVDPKRIQSHAVTVHTSSDSQVLALRGMLIGAVMSVTDILYMRPTSELIDDDMDAENNKIRREWKRLEHGDTSSPLCSRCFLNGCVDPKHKLRWKISNDRERIYSCTRMGDFSRMYEDDHLRGEEVEDVHNNSQVQDWNFKACNDRRFCRTAEGFMGLCPPRTKIGDLLCVFGESEIHGRQIFAIRKKGNNYLLIGQCFIHGVWDKLNRDKFAVSKIKPIMLNLV